MRPVIVLLVLTLLVPTAMADHRPPGSTDEAHPDCEAGQADFVPVDPLVLCEGEHWDGQDASEVGTDCSGTTNTATALGAAFRQCAEQGRYGTHEGGSIGDAERRDATDPLGARVGASWHDGARTFAAGSVYGVGAVALFACVDSCGAATIAFYHEDGTPGNAWTQFTALLRLTQDSPSERDCTFTEYEHGRPWRPLAGSGCWSDNQAWTLTILP